MPKRPAIDLAALTSETAAPLSEAVQRAARPATAALSRPPTEASGKTANLEALAFKVSPAFRKRFRRRAVEADLKLNELLFEALDAWEEKHGLRE